MHFESKSRIRTARRPIGTVALFAVLAAGCGGGTAATGADKPLSETQPSSETHNETIRTEAVPVTGDFSLRDVDGKSHALSDYLGANVVVVSYFTTWCEPCRRELPTLDALQKKYADRNLQVLAVAMDLPETRAEIRPLAKKLALSFPVLIDEDLKAADLFNPRRDAPFTVVIDRASERIWSHMGYVPGDEETLEQVVLSAVEDAPANDADQGAPQPDTTDSDSVSVAP